VSSAELIRVAKGRFRVKGELDFATVGGLLAQGLAAFDGTSEVELDLHGVTRSNSAALALLLEWLDHGRSRGFELHFVNLPESLLAIARMSNVEGLLVSNRS